MSDPVIHVRPTIGTHQALDLNTPEIVRFTFEATVRTVDHFKGVVVGELRPT